MRHALLALKLLLFAYLISLLFFLATGYDPTDRAYRPPFVIFVLDWINLFVHEAGHFFLKPFGMWMHMIGGSLFQCLIPFLLLIVTWRQNVSQIPLPAFWLGESMVNVSVYIQDAPFRQLKLISRGALHDWNYLLTGNFGLAEPLGGTVFVVGLVICTVSVGVGVFHAIQKFRESREAGPSMGAGGR